VLWWEGRILLAANLLFLQLLDHVAKGPIPFDKPCPLGKLYRSGLGEIDVDLRATSTES